jgi:5,10-methylenetetrahydrofolate reductase
MTIDVARRVSRVVNGRGKTLRVSFEFFPPKTE